jgi:hypothetical protein
MGIQIVDAKKALSTHQTKKVKTFVSNYLKDHDMKTVGLDHYLMSEVFPKIIFHDGDVYNQMHHEIDEKTLHIKIVMSRKDNEEMRKRLKETLRQRSYLRNNSEDEKSRLWKVCEGLKKYAPKNVRIPSPTEVLQQRAIFDEMLEKMPNSAFKNYVQDCLNC